MTTYRTKPQFVLAEQYTGDDSAIAAFGVRIHKAYETFDGTLLNEQIAATRSYPLGQQPKECTAVVNNSTGQLQKLSVGDWLVKADDGRIELLAGGDFESKYELDEGASR